MARSVLQWPPMPSAHLDAPLALIGYAAPAGRALRELGLVAVGVPATPLQGVLAACASLKFSGALLAPAHEEAAFGAAQPDGQARKLGRADALSFLGEPRATHTLEDSLLAVVEASGFPLRGARVLVLGGGPSLNASVGLARLGAASLMVASGAKPEAERALNALPAGIQGYAVALNDPALGGLAERADLVVLASGPLPSGLIQPFHTLLDLTGNVHGDPAPRIDAAHLPAERLARQLEHATGQRFRAENLGEVAVELQAV